MTHSNISIFVPHLGCPHACSFCNQRIISGKTEIPHAADVTRLLSEQAERITDSERRENTEIAFFGGSFTAIDREYRRELLSAAFPFTKAGGGCFKGIRFSTRPDCIDGEVLEEAKSFGVTAIELGAQSMSDKVLEMNERGHTAEDVRRGSALIKEFGFELGLQMMVGLYGSTETDEFHTMTEIIKLRPDTARIYPVSVLRGTKLCELFESGEYVLYPFEKAVNICGVIYCGFTSVGIRVIRMGLHAEDGVEDNAVAGFYHPAFGEIVRSDIVKNAILKYYMSENVDSSPIEICANSKLIGAVYGHKKSNRIYFEEKGIPVKISIDNNLKDHEISINKEVQNVFKIT